MADFASADGIQPPWLAAGAAIALCAQRQHLGALSTLDLSAVLNNGTLIRRQSRVQRLSSLRTSIAAQRGGWSSVRSEHLLLNKLSYAMPV